MIPEAIPSNPFLRLHSQFDDGGYPQFDVGSYPQNRFWRMFTPDTDRPILEAENSDRCTSEGSPLPYDRNEHQESTNSESQFAHGNSRAMQANVARRPALSWPPVLHRELFYHRISCGASSKSRHFNTLLKQKMSHTTVVRS